MPSARADPSIPVLHDFYRSLSLKRLGIFAITGAVLVGIFRVVLLIVGETRGAWTLLGIAAGSVAFMALSVWVGNHRRSSQ